MTITGLSSLLPAHERRRAPRHMLAEVVPAIVGRGYGALVDLSASGVRVRHDSPVGPHAHVRICFDWKRLRFDGLAKVVASRLIRPANGTGARYESRLDFLRLTDTAESVLERMLEDLESNNLRRWIANLRGWHDEGPQEVPSPMPESFVRCSYDKGRWERRVTRSSAAPPFGFTVSVDTHPSQIQLLCRTYEQSEDGRQMVRLVARAVIMQQTQ